MAHSPIRTVEILKHEIEKTKQTLVETDESIKKVTGRDGVENRPLRSNNSYDLRLSRDNRYEGRSALTMNRKRLNSDMNIGLGRRTSRNFDDEDYFERSKMSVASSVVATSGLAKSREEIIEQQNKDKESNARNKRMFGLLQGTLASFKTDGGKNERQEKKRREIEKRLEEREKEEKELVKRQRQELFTSKKQNELKLRRLQLKMELVQLHEEWEEQSEQLTNFIRTDAKPNIYYLPKVHTKASLEKLEKSKKLIEAVVSKRRKLLDEELKNILEGKKDEEEDEEEGEGNDDDAPPRKRARKNEKETAADENDGGDSEAEIDKNIREDFQISAVDEVVAVEEAGKEEMSEKSGGEGGVVEEKKLEEVVVEGGEDDKEVLEEGEKDHEKEEKKVEESVKCVEDDAGGDEKAEEVNKDDEMNSTENEGKDDNVSNGSIKMDVEDAKLNGCEGAKVDSHSDDTN